MNIRVDLNTPIRDGTEILFRSPVDCSQITGLIVYYRENGNTASKEFAFADAHGNNVGDIDHLFAENVVVKVILDPDTSMAFVQNADTNAYLESRFNDLDRRMYDDLASAIIGSASGAVISVKDASNSHLHGLALYGKTTQNGTPAVDNPVALESAGDSGNINVEILGKNLIKPVATETSIEKNGVTSTFRADGSIVLNGTNTSGAYTMLFMYGRWSSPVAMKEFLKLRAGTYTFSVTSNDTTSGWSFKLQTHPYTTKYDYTVSAQNNKRTFAADTDWDVILFIGISADATFNNVIIRPQIELGSVATEFEPYKEQTLALSTPNGLLGIPVTSGGNYTDSTGQQWICDEVDFVQGVYVKRVHALVFNGNEAVGAPYGNNTGFFYNTTKNPPIGHTGTNFVKAMCNYLHNSEEYTAFVTEGMLFFKKIGSFATATEVKAWLKDKYDSGTPFTVVYAIDEPIETPLTESVMAAYASLHTNKPNTTVYNDSGAGMTMSYVADTKTYIDNKFTELQNAILANGANV